MSINDLRELSIVELENTSVFRKIKKEIAQANTILNQKINDMNAEDNNE